MTVPVVPVPVVTLLPVPVVVLLVVLLTRVAPLNNCTCIWSLVLLRLLLNAVLSVMLLLGGIRVT